MINTTKICFKCKIEKDVLNYHSHKKNKDGLSHICKPCSTQVNKEWRDKNKEKWMEGYKKYASYDHVKEKQKEYIKLYHIDWKKNNPSYHNEYQKTLKQKNPLKKLSHHISTNINNYIKQFVESKNNSTLNIIGLKTWDEFRNHIESQFTEGMNWGNYGQGKNNETWHIDHIIPISLAKTEEEVYKLNHYTNLKPMWCSDNIRKSNKLL
jgi:hypothetical protein